jgi:hypothetical protein
MTTDQDQSDISATAWLTQIALIVDVDGIEPPILIVRDFQCGPEKLHGHYLSGDRLDLSVPFSRFLGIGANAYTSPDQCKVVRDDMISPVRLAVAPTQVGEPSLERLGRKDMLLAQGRYKNGVLFYERTCFKSQKEVALQALIAHEYERNAALLKKAKGGLNGVAMLSEMCGGALLPRVGQDPLAHGEQLFSPTVPPPRLDNSDDRNVSVDVLVTLANPATPVTRYHRIAHCRFADPGDSTSEGVWYDSGSEGWDLTGWVVGWQKLPPLSAHDASFQVHQVTNLVEIAPAAASNAKGKAADREGPTP